MFHLSPPFFFFVDYFLQLVSFVLYPFLSSAILSFPRKSAVPVFPFFWGERRLYCPPLFRLFPNTFRFGSSPHALYKPVVPFPFWVFALLLSPDVKMALELAIASVFFSLFLSPDPSYVFCHPSFPDGLDYPFFFLFFFLSIKICWTPLPRWRFLMDGTSEFLFFLL